MTRRRLGVPKTHVSDALCGGVPDRDVSECSSNIGGKTDACQSYLYLGRCVRIEGPVQVSRYRGRDGKEKASLDVQATDVKFLTCKIRQGNDASASAARAA